MRILRLGTFSLLLMIYGCNTYVKPDETHIKMKQTETGRQNAIETLDLVDGQATRETVSLFAYMKNIAGKAVLFGHQHETTQVLTWPGVKFRADTEVYMPDTTEHSDTKNSVGDYAAVYGWDTLSIVGDKPEGDVVEHVKAAYKRGGIITVSTHFSNPVTGGGSWDTTPAVTESLPGGEKNAIYRSYLDEVADWAKSLKDDNGRPIPFIFRILHENTASWFWWGAAQSSPAAYKNLFRYTVEYLRDVKGVHNLLYCYSPDANFGATEEAYLERYPGDDYVDVLAFDAYGAAQNNEGWMKEVGEKSELIAKMAKARGKIAALAEIGQSGSDIKKGLRDEKWFTKLLNVLKSNEHTREIVYFLVWRNGKYSHYWVPIVGRNPGSLANFREFYNDELSYFNADLHGVYDNHSRAIPNSETAYIVSPADLSEIAKGDQLIASIKNYQNVKNVTVVTRDRESKNVVSTYKLRKKDDGFYHATFTGNRYAEDTLYDFSLVVNSETKNVADMARVIINNIEDAYNPEIIDTFEKYQGLNELMRGEYPNAGGDEASISLVEGNEAINGKYSAKISYNLLANGYTGINHLTGGLDWSAYDALQLSLKPDGLGQRLVVQLEANGSVWEAYRMMGKLDHKVKLKDLNAHANSNIYVDQLEKGVQNVVIPFTEFLMPGWAKGGGEFDTSNISKFSIYINAYSEDGSAVEIKNGSVVIDDIKAISL